MRNLGTSLHVSRRLHAAAVVAGLALFLAAGMAHAADCGRDAGGFQAWLKRFSETAHEHGISKATLEKGLKGVGYDTHIIGLDRNQKYFKLSFEEFAVCGHRTL